ncbi:DUF4224 domain-containing protein [Erwinia billingiae]|uniref:DUF4224 domain-containing protein n=1 Tax=Erwinia billingiae TaxID=182337 RepID=UPI002247969F|nr:DUF4224 domain-containing protein [Erwinia billingiae]MCX0499697.1 DUF4224 domain-containing protein [Erwinia billingiae]
MGHSKVLTPSDLKEITGYSFPSKQCESLRNSGIFFIKRPDGRPSTTWSHVENPILHRHKPMPDDKEEPNFEAI